MFDNVEITLYTILKTLVVLSLIYTLVRILSFLMGGISLPSRQKNRIEYALQVLRNSFLPITLFVVVVLLCFWQPLYLGIPALLGMLFFYGPLKNFLLGFLIRGRMNLSIGSFIKLSDIQGRIEAWYFAGVKLATKNGISILPYRRLVEEVYEVLDQGDSLNTVQIKIEKSSDSKANVVDQLTASPFIKINTNISVLNSDSDKRLIISLIPKSDIYLGDIHSIIKDAGYSIVQ